MKSWSDRSWTSRDGLKLYFRDYPGRTDRPPLLCLPGLTRNSRDFEDLAERYAGDWRVLAVDLRGRGLSDRDPDSARYLPPTYAADILKLLDEEGIKRAVFLGTSLGGIVTMIIAAIQPQRIAAAMLNDVGPDLDEAGLARISTYVGKREVWRDWAEAAAALRRRHGPIHPAYDDSDWLRYARRVCRETEHGVEFDYDMAIVDNFETARTVPAVDAWPFFSGLSGVPLLILRGEHSDLLAPGGAQAMLDAHPDAELVTVPGVGHAPDLSEPEAVAAIDRLLARVR